MSETEAALSALCRQAAFSLSEADQPRQKVFATEFTENTEINLKKQLTADERRYRPIKSKS